MEKLIQEETNRYAKKFYENLYNAGYKIMNDEKYVDSRKPVTLKCEKGHVTKMIPKNFNRGRHCNVCNKAWSQGKNANNFEDRLSTAGYSRGKGVNYKGDSVAINLVCDKGHDFKVIPSNFLRGRRCSTCSGEALRKISAGRFYKEVDQAGYELADDEKYVDSETHVQVKCSEGHVYKTTPKNFNSGSRCSVCASTERGLAGRMTHDEFVQIVEDEEGDEYTVLTKYETSANHVEIKHNRCGLINSVKPNAFVSGRRCPPCSYKAANDKIRHTKKDIKEFILEAEGNEYELVSDFVNYRTKMKVKHNKENCGKSWWVDPNSFVHSGRRCPSCNFSRGEKEIEFFLDENGISYESQYRTVECRDIKKLPFDFAILENDKVVKLIEYDGIQHFEEIEFFGGEKAFEGVQRRDNIKNEYAKDNNIDLLRIPYWDYDNIEEILKENILLQHT